MSQEVSPGQLSVKTSTFALRPVGQNSDGVELGAIDIDGVLDGAEDGVELGEIDTDGVLDGTEDGVELGEIDTNGVLDGA